MSSTNGDSTYFMKGSCYCGAITIKALSKPMSVGICHCAPCRKFGGSLCFFTIWPRNQILVEGDLVATDHNKTPFQMGYPTESEKCGTRVDTINGNDTICFPKNGCVRHTCSKCHSNVLNHLIGDLVDVMGGVWDTTTTTVEKLGQEEEENYKNKNTYVFEPEIHINYESAIYKIKDGKPKFRNYPSIFGGDDELMDE